MKQEKKQKLVAEKTQDKASAQQKKLEKLGFLQLVFDFYTAPVF